MAHRGRSRKAGPRTASGQQSRAGRSAADTAINALLLAHRLDPIDAESADKIRRAQLELDRFPAGYPRTPQEAARQRECIDIVHTLGTAGKNPNLSFPLGITYERGIITKIEFDAGVEYARLYRVVWGKLRADIEAALDRLDTDAGLDPSESLKTLLSTGKITAPPLPASCFRQLIPGDPSQTFEVDPAEYQKNRERAGERLGKASLALKQTRLPALPGLADFGLGVSFGALSGAPADFGCLQIVEDVVIYGGAPSWLTPREAYTPPDLRDRAAFQAGLRALAEHLGYDKRERRQAGPPAPAEPPQHLAAADVLAAAERRSVRRGKGLDVVFSPDRDGRDESDVVDQSVNNLMRRSKLPPAA